MTNTEPTKGKAGALVLIATTVGCLWAYPLAQGGLGNLVMFAAWSLGLMLLFLGLVAMSCKIPSPRHKSPRVIRLAVQLSWLGGIAFVAYSGAFALSSLHLFAFGMLYLAGQAKSQELEL